MVVSDKSGKGTLEVIGEAKNFNKWMYDTISPFAKGQVLEIGSGIGNISHFFLKNNFELMLSDLRKEYCALLQKKYIGNPNLLGISELNLVDSDFEQKYAAHLNKYDTVYALNVIEHIENDILAIANCKKLLKTNGHLIILVPSYNALYNNFDKELGHFRRYNKKSLSALFLKNNLKIFHSQYFNFTGIFGWVLSGSILKKKTIPSGQMKLYNSMVPIFKIIDKIIFEKMGLSTVVVGKKN